MSRLFLIPNGLSEEGYAVPTALMELIAPVRLFFVEEPKAARRLLKRSDPFFPVQDCRFCPLNEHTLPADIAAYAAMLPSEDAGIISESGCPCVADPGAELVAAAHGRGITVVPLTGPSSIVMALMASGLNGQNFAFNGYLPREAEARRLKIKSLEQRALKEGQTQILMDTPYRNNALMADLLNTLQPGTRLCAACDITGPEQSITTRTVGQWRKSNLPLPKRPALFIIGQGHE